MRFLCSLVIVLSSLLGCVKDEASTPDTTVTSPTTGTMVKYTIPAGQHFCENTSYQPILTDKLRFTVKFDSSAIYQTAAPENQLDINKLFGFSDNSKHHHQYSARFGWCWSEGALRLFAYVYNDGVRSFQELATAAIGEEISCTITVLPGHYQFSVAGRSVSLPRTSSGNKADGYLLYPYFGGNEAAPHAVHIWIRKES